MHTLSQKKSFVLVISFASALFLLKSIFLWTASMRGLGITTWILDDTFIIARIALNIALGYGFSYDFTHATTGAPPLWTYITSINHLLFPTLDSAMKFTFIETTFIGSLATLVVFLLARKVSDNERVAWIAFVLSSLTANAFFEAMNGMDTSLFTLGALVSFAMYLGVFRPKNMSDKKWAILTGFSVGITCLIRGDGIFVLATIGLLEIVSILRGKINKKERFLNLVLLSLVSLACISLLLGWQMIATGSPLLGNQVGRRELAMSLHGFDFSNFILLKYIKIVIWNIFQLERLIQIATGGAVFALFALLGGWLMPRLRPLANITIVYITIFFGLLVTYQWYFPDLHGLRYVNPAVHLLFIFMAGCIASLPSFPWRRFVSWTIVVAIIVLSHYWFYDYTTHLTWAKGMTYTGHPSEKDEEASWATIDWVKKNLPAGTVVGVRDHGRFALFSDLPTQDIAGNIDPTVPLLARTTGLAGYLQSQNVSYLLIPSLDTRQDLIYRVLFKELNLRLVKDAPSFRNANLYKIIW